MDVRFGGLLPYTHGDNAHGQLRCVAGFEGAASMRDSLKEGIRPMPFASQTLDEKASRGCFFPKCGRKE